ncbi:MAG: TIGR04255 family protein [Jatrophihabitans sp.]|uniref:TIGR04255 family protein n=1 Tax=Jatrophihabitans sp. TaxID=1932789 RepID=UPI003F810753
MDQRVDQIASFTDPPVVEVVTSVRFAPMPPLAYVKLGTLWESTWQSSFPTLEVQPAYAAPVEVFGRSPMAADIFNFSFGALQPASNFPRLWMISPSGNELLQVQQDWFAANWRKNATPGGAAGAEYDRWTARRVAFAQHWQTLATWLHEHQAGMHPLQCEVTYINHIAPIEGIWSSHSDAANIFSGLRLAVHDSVALEQFGLRSQAIIPGEGDLPEARLHVSVSAAFAGPGPEPTPIIVLELTVRGAPQPDGDLVTFLDRGRRLIVQTFVQLTTDQIRQAWGQE